MPSTSSTTPVLSSSGVSQPDNASVTAKESDTDRVDNRSESGTTSEMHPDQRCRVGMHCSTHQYKLPVNFFTNPTYKASL